MNTTSQLISHRSLNNEIPMTEEEFNKFQIDELAKHRWIEVEKKTKEIQALDKTVAEVAAEQGITEKELLKRFNLEADITWVTMHAKNVRAYHQHHIIKSPSKK